MDQLCDTILKYTQKADIYISGFVKFFGCLAHLCPRDISETLQLFTNILFTLVEGHDQTQKVLGLETLGFIGATIEGKRALSKMGESPC